MEKKVIFLDIDGTIIDVPRNMLNISDKTKYAINELIKNGHMVFIASGRPKCLMPDYLENIKGLNYLTCNGGVTFLNDGTIIGEHKFDKELVKYINNYCVEHDCLYFDENIDAIYTKDINDQAFDEYVHGWGIDAKSFKNGEELDDCYMMMAAFKSIKQSNQFYLYFKDIVDAVPQYGYNACDISLKGICKATGVKDVLNYYHMDVNDAYAFGDGLNDKEMLKAVGHGYLMANGNSELKAEISLIAPDVIDDGFYQIMVKEGLIKPLD